MTTGWIIVLVYIAFIVGLIVGTLAAERDAPWSQEEHD